MIELHDIESLNNWLNGKHSIFVVGAGEFGKIIGAYVSKYENSLKGYVDRKDSGDVDGTPIFPYSFKFPEDAVFLISSFDYGKEMAADLSANGISQDSLAGIMNRQIVLDAYEYVYHYRQYTAKLSRFKDAYKGKRAFIIGNGPSLRIEDLDKLKNEYCFAVNSVFSLFSQTEWRPYFYCTQDKDFCRGILTQREYVRKISEGCKEVFFYALREGFSYAGDPEFKNLNFYMLEDGYRPEGSKFSEDITDKIYASGTVTYTSIQLACYMGFSELYLTGFDHTYSVEQQEDGSIVTNNVDSYKGNLKKINDMIEASPDDFAEIYRMNAAYSSALNYCSNKGISIINVTRGGNLNIFDRGSFDELF